MWTLIFAWIVGAALGAFFFGGLWWTIRRGARSSYPALLFTGSALVRTGVVLVGFFIISDGHWERLLACLAGFVVLRLVMLRRLRPLHEYASESEIKETQT